MTYYINYCYDRASGNETIDEFDTRREANKMLKEYQLAYGGYGRTWVSTRACKGWNQSREEQMRFKRDQMSREEKDSYIDKHARD